MTRYEKQSARIGPAVEPLDAEVQHAIDEQMRGRPPLTLFTTLARDRRLFFKFFNSGLLDRGNLTIREREIVIGRVTAQCHAEYEWGVHHAVFAAQAGFGAAEASSLLHGGADDLCWNLSEQVLLRVCDGLHAEADIDDNLWSELERHFSPEAVLEILLLAGFYRTVSYLVRALRLPLEPGATRFDEVSP